MLCVVLRRYSYWRKAPPARDWILEPGFDPQTCYYGGHGIARHVAHSFAWLRGEGEIFRVMGGQAWPWMTENQIGPSYGYRDVNAMHLPAWADSTTDDGYVRSPSSTNPTADSDSDSDSDGNNDASGGSTGNSSNLRGLVKAGLLALAAKL